MNHPSDDRLLLHAYGELPEPQAAETDAHLAACSTCRAQFERLEHARVALDVAMPRTRQYVARRWVATGLAAAAVIAAVLLTNSQPPRIPDQRWRPASVWSANAGYLAGGRTMVEIDAQLTRLEQERYYGQPD
ncbi:MAG TPA: zf-HC2 domain-containing protein [Gemmatimonadales bacterium]|nr:zf-HC2 domain-containing protein [Gemmatimonadales bacterium]